MAAARLAAKGWAAEGSMIPPGYVGVGVGVKVQVVEGLAARGATAGLGVTKLAEVAAGLRAARPVAMAVE